jgi:hypothetical protein
MLYAAAYLPAFVKCSVFYNSSNMLSANPNIMVLTKALAIALKNAIVMRLTLK